MEEQPIQSLIALLDSLQTFRWEVSESVTQVLSQDSHVLSLPLMGRCFGLIKTMNGRFALLISRVDHPMRRWEGVCVKEYMSYTLSLLDQLNLITSSLSHLSQSLLWLSHALSLLQDSSTTSALSHLKPIQPSLAVIPNRELSPSQPCDDGSKKERIVHQAIQDMQNIGSWVCGALLSALTGNTKPYLETKRSIRNFTAYSLFLTSGLGIFDGMMGGETSTTLVEVTRVNHAVARLEVSLTKGELCSRAAEDLRRELNSLQREKEKLIKEVDGVFSEILDSRNQLLSTLRSC